jgi:outer membrane protein OmpA-like peptidoglycan-associated protein
MAVNLLDTITKGLGSDFAGMAGRFLGESQSTTQSALGSLVPVLLGALAQKGSTAEGAGSLLNLINSPNVNADWTSSLGSLFSGGGAGANQLASMGQGLVSSLLGEKAGGLVNALSSQSGMKASSATNLLAMVVPLILAFLKKFVSQQGMNASGLMSLLGGQGEHLKNALDPRLTGALGYASPSALLGSIGQTAAAAAQRVTGAAAGAASAAGSAATAVASEAKRSIFARPWFWIALAILAVLLFMMNRCSTEQAAQKAADATKAAAKATADAAKATADAAKAGAGAVARAMKSIELPGGAKIEAPDSGFIESLIVYLRGTDPTGRGIAFDDLHFETGSATLQPKSNAQLEQLAAVLKAFPTAEVGVNGYSDNVGDAAANKKLSEDRANAVKTALAGMGVPVARIASAGFGEGNPIASNDTEEGRAKNRRVELVVVKR